jgi:3D-(3,5/4)-trihydroxycyclohexane-1,2-dione acylhydrolase (decyclizing)
VSVRISSPVGANRRHVRSTTRDRKVRLTTAQALIRYLARQYSERDNQTERLIPAAFGIFGHGNVAGIGDALNELSNELPYYQPKNEQSMVHVALGFARARLRKATFACTTSIGPGATNMLTAAATAATNRLPVLLLPADYYASRLQGPALQQLEHPLSGDLSVNDAFRPLSRYFDRILRPEQLLAALPEAMRVLTDPADVGPVTLSLPQDVQSEAYDFPGEFLEPRVWRIERRPPDPTAISDAVRLLRVARRPAIIAGGGVHYSEAWTELAELATGCGIPVGETRSGKGAMRTDSPLLLGATGISGTTAAAQIMRTADAVICVGTRLTDFVTGSRSIFQNPNVEFITINVSAHDAHKHRGVPVVSDAREALRALNRACEDAGLRPRPEYVSEITTLRTEWQEILRADAFTDGSGSLLTGAQLVKILNEEARPGDIVVGASGATSGDLHKLWDATGNRPCHLEFGFSCMGYEIPGGLGVRMAQPDGEVFVVIGDGTYLMNSGEIVTAVQEGLKVTIIVSDNRGYQVIRRTQVARTGRSFGNEFRIRSRTTGRLEGDFLHVDFAANAKSLGAVSWQARTADEFRAALQSARAEKTTSVIVVETDPYRYAPDSGVWFDVAPPAVSEDPTVRSRRAEYERHRTKQRYYS